jgi:signal peptidase I
MRDKKMNRKRRKGILLFVRGWTGSILIALLIATSFKSAIADWNDVPTGSMNPTIVEGDRIFINKLSYDLKIPYTTQHLATWDHPKHGDIVVFFSPSDGIRLVKRVVGVPGDRIEMKDNRLLINDKALEYVPIPNITAGQGDTLKKSRVHYFSENLVGKNHAIALTPHHLSLRSFGPLRIPENRYFMMGDNRDNSADSRYFGLVHRNQIVGQATAVVISLDINHHYQPRWKRFFTKLN